MIKRAKIDYRGDLEKAAKQMILIHRVDTLIKLILRTIIRNLKVTHAGLLLYDKQREAYIVRVSKGKGGIRVPAGLAKVKKDNVLIKYFTNRKLNVFNKDYLILSELNALLDLNQPIPHRRLLKKLRFQLSLYNAKACIAGLFRGNLVCIFFLGQKTNHQKFTKEELGFLSVLSSDAVMAIQNAWLFQDLDNQLKLNRSLFLQTVKALANAIEAKDKYTLGHTERVSKYSLAIAQEIKKAKSRLQKNWDKFFEDLRVAALLHDIGKIGIKESVLNKSRKLNQKEQREMEQHPLIAYFILNQIDELKESLLGIKHHHEHYDGSGYPAGLKGKNIPLIAQIISVVDAFDAITTDRPYRKGLPPAAALQAIRKDRSRQFSPLVVDAFMKAYKKLKF